ncbi:MAG: NUDIX hydrolase, partial [Actinomycetes bacterium]
ERGPGGRATLRWRGRPAAGEPAYPATSAATLQRAVTVAADDALYASGIRRLEASAAAGDLVARRALLRSGFRVEGVLRQAEELPGGAYEDRVLYARLASDTVDGPHGFSGVMNSALPRKRLIAHVLLRDDAGRVLLCETAFKTDWELPGGIVEPGESPRLGAVREVREELGIDLEVGRLLVVDWMPPYLGWEDAMELIFDGGTVAPADLERFVLQPTEIRRVELATVGEAAGLVTPIAHRRLAIAAALGPEEMAYTEDGSATR